MIKLLLLMVVLRGQTETGIITGHVRMPDGKPAAGVRVYASPTASTLSTSGSGQTDVSGVFRIQNVPPGHYLVFAAATSAAITEAGETMHMAVSTPTNFAALPPRGNGTYFPGTSDPQNAGIVTVSPGMSQGNIDIPLAQGAYPFGNFPLRIVRGKFVVEGGGAPTLRSGALNLFFSDGPGNRAATVTFLDATQTAAAASTRVETTSQRFLSLTARIPPPDPTDGRFRLVLPEGVYRVIQPAPQGGGTGPAIHAGRHYVKAVSFGTADLLKDLMTVGPQSQEELVITLAKCAESTPDPMCR